MTDIATDTAYLSATHDVAEQLDLALRTRTPIPPPSAMVAGFDVDMAYDVQQVNIRRALCRGDIPTGHKIGLTSEAMQKQLGVDQPDFGILLASMATPNGQQATQSLLQPRIEAEIAFLLGADLEGDNLTIDDVFAATRSVMPALEIIDSRVANWKITLPDTIADNASSGAYVVGDEVPLPADLRDIELTLFCEGQQVASGFGRAALGHPAECVLWLARTLHARGEMLQKGSVILSGAVHAAVPVLPGQYFEVRSAMLGGVSVSFPEDAA